MSYILVFRFTLPDRLADAVITATYVLGVVIVLVFVFYALMCLISLGVESV